MTYKELKNQLIQASESYYKKSVSIMSDYDFDMALKELEKMEAEQGFADPDSPTQKPGADSDSALLENKHKRPMLSLENTYNEADIEKFWNDMKKEIHGSFSILINPKWDGGSAAIRYSNGKVIKGLSRGNGEYGEDMTQNIKYCADNIWKKTTFSGEARGELIITTSGFAELNSDNKYQNARNLLSGSMKLLNLSEFKERAPFIKFFAYWLEDSKNKTYEEDLKELEAAGFDVGPYFVCHTLNEVKEAIEKIKNMKFDCAIDGAVLKLNEKQYWDKIGSTAKFPRWAKAYKYEQVEVESTIRNITFDVGRTGKISVLAHFDPVFIDGSTVSKATLNNKDFYDDMDVAIGDTCSIIKAACIIPQIVSVNERPSNRKKIPFPTICPSCGYHLKKHKEEQADMFCDNPECKRKIINSIINYTHSIECDGFAEIVVEKLYEAGLLRKISDLYFLQYHKTEISRLDRLSMKMANKLCENIESTKQTDFWRVLAGLNIPNVGPKMAKILAKQFKTMKVIQGLTKQDLIEVEDIAEITAEGIVKYFQITENQRNIAALSSFGVSMAIKETESTEKPKINLAGKTFCITGALSLVRSKYVDMIEALGGKVVSSVSTKTSYLITNDKNTGTTKNIAAKKYGIPILNEKELLELCGELELLKELKENF